MSKKFLNEFSSKALSSSFCKEIPELLEVKQFDCENTEYVEISLMFEYKGVHLITQNPVVLPYSVDSARKHIISQILTFNEACNHNDRIGYIFYHINYLLFIESHGNESIDYILNFNDLEYFSNSRDSLEELIESLNSLSKVKNYTELN